MEKKARKKLSTEERARRKASRLAKKSWASGPLAAYWANPANRRARSVEAQASWADGPLAEYKAEVLEA